VAGRQEAATEWRCDAKTRVELVDRIVAAVRAVHGYDVPEVIAVPILGGDPDYLAWLDAEATG
jgi:periplasmic divalent cation tolerance protein